MFASPSSRVLNRSYRSCLKLVFMQENQVTRQAPVTASWVRPHPTASREASSQEEKHQRKRLPDPARGVPCRPLGGQGWHCREAAHRRSDGRSAAQSGTGSPTRPAAGARRSRCEGPGARPLPEPQPAEAGGSRALPLSKCGCWGRAPAPRDCPRGTTSACQRVRGGHPGAAGSFRALFLAPACLETGVTYFRFLFVFLDSEMLLWKSRCALRRRDDGDKRPAKVHPRSGEREPRARGRGRAGPGPARPREHRAAAGATGALGAGSGRPPADPRASRSRTGKRPCTMHCAFMQIEVR